MSDIYKFAEHIVSTEGGFVDDPDDPGGVTKYGVTLKTLKRLGMDLTRDGRVTTEDVHAVTRAVAIQVFIEHYFKRPKLHLLPSGVQFSAFDMYVNSGQNAVRLLQGLLNKMGFALQVDGIIGPMTQTAAAKSAKMAPAHFADAYAIERRNYYFSIADKRPSLRKFARTRSGGKGGWIKRAESFLSTKYHLSDEEFQERTASWV